MACIQQGGGTCEPGEVFRARSKDGVVPRCTRGHVPLHEREQALGRCPGRERLEVVALVGVGVVHDGLHDDRVFEPGRVGERADGGGLHLHAEHFSYGRRQACEDLVVLYDLVAAGDGPDVDAKRLRLGERVAVHEERAADVLPPCLRQVERPVREQALLPEPRERLVEVGAHRLVREGVGAAEHPLEDPVALLLVAPRPEREPPGLGVELEALRGLLPGRWMEPVHLDVLLLLDDALAVDGLGLALAGVVLPDAVGDDHVAERDVAASACADAAHGEAADVVLLDRVCRSDDGARAAHAERLGDGDGEGAAALRVDVAEGDGEAHRPLVLGPRARSTAGVEDGPVLVGHGGDDEDVGAEHAGDDAGGRGRASTKRGASTGPGRCGRGRVVADERVGEEAAHVVGRDSAGCPGVASRGQAPTDPVARAGAGRGGGPAGARLRRGVPRVVAVRRLRGRGYAPRSPARARRSGRRWNAAHLRFPVRRAQARGGAASPSSHAPADARGDEERGRVGAARHRGDRQRAPPYASGVALGFDWDRQTTSVRLGVETSGSSRHARSPSRRSSGAFASVRLAFASAHVR